MQTLTHKRTNNKHTHHSTRVNPLITPPPNQKHAKHVQKYCDTRTMSQVATVINREEKSTNFPKNGDYQIH